jgi:ferritin
MQINKQNQQQTMNQQPGQGSKQLDANNLKVLEDQLNYESLMNKKFSAYAQYCTDTQLKNLCQQASQKHKQHYNELFNYLNSHQ